MRPGPGGGGLEPGGDFGSVPGGRAPEAQKIARRVLEAAGETANAQVKITPDADKADALRAGEVGILVMPDKKLAELLDPWRMTEPGGPVGSAGG